MSVQTVETNSACLCLGAFASNSQSQGQKSWGHESAAGPMAESAGELLKEGQAVGVVLRHEGEGKEGPVGTQGSVAGAWAGGGADELGAGHRALEG